MIDYAKNIELMQDLNEDEKQFLSSYFVVAKKDLKSLYKAGSKQYKKWYFWLKQHQYIISKIEHLQNQTIIRNSKEAFDFVLNECVDLVYYAKFKNNRKIEIDALNLINKICGLESYAQQTIANLNQASKQSDLAKLTTAQLQQLASSVSSNLALLADSKTNLAEREQCDKSEHCVSDTQQAIIIDELNKD